MSIMISEWGEGAWNKQGILIVKGTTLHQHLINVVFSSFFIITLSTKYPLYGQFGEKIPAILRNLNKPREYFQIKHYMKMVL